MDRLEKILMREADIYGVVVAELKMHRVPQALHRAPVSYTHLDVYKRQV